MATTKVFTYGLLQPDYSPPRSMLRYWPATVYGKLFDLGPYPGATHLGQSEAGAIAGYVIEIDEMELAELDEFEEVDRGLYRRLKIQTVQGDEVWAYEYLLPVDSKPQIPRWTK